MAEAQAAPRAPIGRAPILPPWLPIAVVAALITVGAAALLFSTFMMYDDEGYVLFSLQTFVDVGGLYERVYTQYGPFFFLFHQLLHFAGLEFSNTGARLLTLVFWLGAVGFSSAIVWRATRSSAATVFTLGGVFLHLWPMISEPSHPGGLIVFATAALAWSGVHWRERPDRFAVAAGVLCSALLFTKINVGVFAFTSAAAWWLLHANVTVAPFRLRAALATLGLTLLPLALMRAQLHLGWVAIFATVSAAAAAGTALAAAKAAVPSTTLRDLAAFFLAALVVALVTCAGILAQGTSLPGLLEGVILGPLRHPQVYSAHVKWRDGAVAAALASVAFAAWATFRPAALVQRIVAVGRLVAAAVFVATVTFPLPLNSHAFALSFGLSSIWWFVYPLSADADSRPARSWLALLLVVQALHAFPVAGSQISWGTFLWIPLAAIGARDGWRHLIAGRGRQPQTLSAVGAAAIALVLAVDVTRYVHMGLTRFRDSDSLRLPGAEWLRLPSNFTTTLRVLAQNSAAHADVLFSLPGMHSFHAWTGVPAPTTHNATHWFTLLSLPQQDAIRARLEAAPRSCLLVQRNIYDFLVENGIATESPLTVWLKENYEPAFTIETYEFWVRKGRRIAPLGTAVAREAAAGVTPRYQVSVVLAAPDLRNITSIELARVDSDQPRTVHRWIADNARITVTPLNSAGTPAGETRPATFPLQLNGLVRLELTTDVFPGDFRIGFGAVLLRSGNGGVAAEARFVR